MAHQETMTLSLTPKTRPSVTSLLGKRRFFTPEDAGLAPEEQGDLSIVDGLENNGLDPDSPFAKDLIKPRIQGQVIVIYADRGRGKTSVQGIVGADMAHRFTVHNTGQHVVTNTPIRGLSHKVAVVPQCNSPEHAAQKSPTHDVSCISYESVMSDDEMLVKYIQTRVCVPWRWLIVIDELTKISSNFSAMGRGTRDIVQFIMQMRHQQSDIFAATQKPHRVPGAVIEQVDKFALVVPKGKYVKGDLADHTYLYLFEHLPGMGRLPLTVEAIVDNYDYTRIVVNTWIQKRFSLTDTWHNVNHDY